MSKKVVVYTAVAGAYDGISKLSYINDAYDYVCFTDRSKISSGNWKQRPFVYENDDPVRVAKHPKILPHNYFPEYEYSVWIDGNVDILGDLDEIFFEMEKEGFDVAVFPHHQRNCIYQEADFCSERGKDFPQLMKTQVEQYKKEGFPSNYGMLFGCILIRRHNAELCRQLMDAWWNQIEKASRRDQLSFSYVLWKQQREDNILWLPGTVENNKWFVRKYHRHQNTLLKRCKRWIQKTFLR